MRETNLNQNQSKKRKKNQVQKVLGVRQTSPAPKAYLKGTKGGRPKGTKKRFHFSQTKLGFMLKYETPIEYNLIMQDKDVANYFYEPPIETIELIASSSSDPSFKKPKFKRYLAEYKRDGVCCGRPKLLTPERAEYYENMYQRKLYEMGKTYAPIIEKQIQEQRELEDLIS